MSSSGLQQLQFTKPGVDDPRQGRHLPALPGTEWSTLTAQHQREPGRDQRNPCDVVGLRRDAIEQRVGRRIRRRIRRRVGQRIISHAVGGARVVHAREPSRALASFDEHGKPLGARGRPIGGDEPTVLKADDRGPLGAAEASGVVAQRPNEVATGGRPNQGGRRFQGIEAGIEHARWGQAEVLHIHAVHLLHLGDEERGERRVGEVDHQLIDGPSGALFEDVDAHDIGPDRPDAARHGTKRTRTIGKPNTKYEGRHARHPTDPP